MLEEIVPDGILPGHLTYFKRRDKEATHDTVIFKYISPLQLLFCVYLESEQLAIESYQLSQLCGLNHKPEDL